MEQEFGLVYRENAGLVYRYLLSLGCTGADAEDITQETFVRALLSIDSFRGEARLSVWLCGIARNLWYTALKKRRREVPLAASPEAPGETEFFEWMDLVDRLEEPYRDVFRKRALGGWEYGEIARFHGKTESWARVTYHRARLKLQEGAMAHENEL